MKYRIEITVDCEQPAYHEFIRGVLHEKASDFAEHIEDRLNKTFKVYGTTHEVKSEGIIEAAQEQK